MRRTRSYTEPGGSTPPDPAATIGPKIADTEAQSDIFTPSVIRRRNTVPYRPGIATELDATPVGTAGVLARRSYTSSTTFIVDNERKPAYVPDQTLAVKSSAFQPYQCHHVQFILNPDFGRVPNGQYPRGETDLSAYARTAPGPDNFAAAPPMRIRPRFRRVFAAIRPDTAPEVY